jgi:malate dehydrogenase (oxaloacetate-decarboxylating)
MDYKLIYTEADQTCLEVSATDYSLIANPLLNKGMAFSHAEREAFNLLGLIPPYIADLASQRERSYLAFSSKPSNLGKYIYLRDLQDSNETLFYSVLLYNLEEMLPIVYTPTVGLGCEQFSHVYRRPRGIFIAYPYKDQIDKILSNPRFDKVKVVVVSDGERILGLGDQGAGGMGIPIGKLALYSACAGIYPAATLPILLDTGTNNPDLIKDPLYVGWRHERIRGKDYEEFIASFVSAIKKRWPHVLLQWEDFAQLNANPILQRYRDQLCTFNDDIQGTAAVVCGALLAAIQVTKKTLAEQRIVIVGAGSAGIGISHLITREMMHNGMSEREARACFYLIDKHGLLIEGMELLDFQQPYARKRREVAHWHLKKANGISLQEVVKNVKPTLLLGVSGQHGIFSEAIVREMAAHVERPIIFPLSNPPNRCEATPQDLMQWTQGKAIISTGSPYPDVLRNGKPSRIDQTNNCYIFPGLGLGVIAVKSKRVTENMFIQAAKALADLSPAKNDPYANLLPPLARIREVSLHVAIAVAKEAIAENLAGFIPPIPIEQYLYQYMWVPRYLPYKKV